jgi:hypothetical protein
MEFVDGTIPGDTWVWQVHDTEFGTVPPTGVVNITLMLAAMFAFLAVTIGLWGRVMKNTP